MASTETEETIWLVVWQAFRDCQIVETTTGIFGETPNWTIWSMNRKCLANVFLSKWCQPANQLEPSCHFKWQYAIWHFEQEKRREMFQIFKSARTLKRFFIANNIATVCILNIGIRKHPQWIPYNVPMWRRKIEIFSNFLFRQTINFAYPESSIFRHFNRFGFEPFLGLERFAILKMWTENSPVRQTDENQQFIAYKRSN